MRRGGHAVDIDPHRPTGTALEDWRPDSDITQNVGSGHDRRRSDEAGYADKDDRAFQRIAILL